MHRQCALLNLARSGVSAPRPYAGADNLTLMRRIDELHLGLPFYRSRRMMFDSTTKVRGQPEARAAADARDRRRALVPRPGTSKATPGHDLSVSAARAGHHRADHVCTDASPTSRSRAAFCIGGDHRSATVQLGLAAVELDRHRLCVEALEDALLRHRKPKIFDTDQGPQFHQHHVTGESKRLRHDFDGRRRPLMDDVSSNALALDRM